MNKNEIYFYKQKNIEIIKGHGLVELPYHTHNSYIIGKVNQGTFQMCLDGQEYEMKEGMIFIVPSNIGISMTPKEIFAYTVFCFSNSAADRMNQFRPKQLVFDDKKHVFEQILTSFQQMNQKMNVMQSFINWAFKDDNCKAEKKEHSKIVENAIFYMTNHADQKCSIKEIAEHLYVSQYYFSRLFKQEMGITPKQYMIQNKLRIVKEKVIEEGRETDVAMDMEFAAQSHMCSVFKKYMGISISDYKKNLVQIS